MYPHRIRLRGPWQFESPAGPAGRVRLPCRWGEVGLGDFAGRVRFQRHFGYPGQIDDEERVWLTFTGAEAVAGVTLNGQRLGDGGAAAVEFDVTRLLGQRNELVVEVEAPPAGGGLWDEVALEVRRTAFLRGVRTWLVNEGEEAGLHAAGEVVGTSDRPLDLYVLLDRRTAAYTSVEPRTEGQPFHLKAEQLPPADAGDGGECPASVRRVRVELVGGAVVWYAVESFLP